MASVIERAVAQREGLPTRHIDIAEWGEGDEPLRVFWRPWTLLEKRSIYKVAGPDDQKLSAFIVARKALNEDGKRIFTDADAHTLIARAHGQVVSRVAAEIMADAEPGGDDGGEDGDDSARDDRNADLAGEDAAVDRAEKN